MADEADPAMGLYIILAQGDGQGATIVLRNIAGVLGNGRDEDDRPSVAIQAIRDDRAEGETFQFGRDRSQNAKMLGENQFPGLVDHFWFHGFCIFR